VSGRAPRRGARLAALLLAAGTALATAACGGSHAPKGAGGTGTAAGPPGAQVFTIHGNDRDQFLPQTVQAQVGVLTLRLQNGGVPHDLVFADRALPGISAVSGTGTKSTRLTFTQPGTFAFECTIHPGMDGRVVVSAPAGG
jgi:plastocyanin